MLGSPVVSLKIAVYGTGGLGGYYGGRLAQAGAEVHLLARGPHLEAIRARGLRVESPLGDFEGTVPATEEPSNVGQCDFVLFCVKSFETDAAAEGLHPLIGEDTAVLSLQNGVDNEEKIARAVGWPRVMGGAAFIFSTIREPGVIAHTGGPTRIVFGEMDGSRTRRAQAFLELCLRARIPCELHSNVRQVLWDKFAFICAQAGMTAAVRLPLVDIRDSPESWTLFRELIVEVCAVARAEGVELGEDTVDRHLAFGRELEPGSLSSLHYDMTHGRRMELETLHGNVVRLARKHAIPVPATTAIYGILKPWARRNERDQAR